MSTRQRIPASERREELITAAVHEFAHGGLHGTPVQRIASRVGVAQPYVFSLFPSKLDLFLAAVDRCFERFTATFSEAAAEFTAGRGPAGCAEMLEAMGQAYVRQLQDERELLLLQLQSYVACDDERVRDFVRRRYAQLLEHAATLSGAEGEELDDFFRHGMALNVAAAMGVETLSCDSPWVSDELAALRAEQATA
jgi:AcrR family transcriptional regulator